MTPDIRETMEGWARWRHYRFGGYGKTMTQKFMEGVPGTNCPVCAGRGRKPVGWNNGKRTYIACPCCNGAGRVVLDQKASRAIERPCPVCAGHDGRGDRPGEIGGATCPRCRGRGRMVTVEHKVNPAFIRSTFVGPGNPLYERVDRLVCELRQRNQTLGYYFVIHAEYCDARGGTQSTKAMRVTLTADAYESRLRRALEWLEAALADERACDAIPFPYKAA